MRGPALAFLAQLVVGVVVISVGFERFAWILVAYFGLCALGLIAWAAWIALHPQRLGRKT